MQRCDVLSPELLKLFPPRNAAVRRLPLLLMQAAGVDAEEIGDDKH
jgi:hypothetical protein